MNTVQREPGYRVLGQQAQLAEFRDGVAQGLGEGLDEGAAAGGAGLVEDIVDAPLRILKHFMSWPPMSMMKSTSGLKWRGGVEVGHGLHQPEVAGEGIFDEVLAVAGDGRALDLYAVAAQLVEFPQLGQNDPTGLPWLDW